jgi:hypothetical protein
MKPRTMSVRVASYLVQQVHQIADAGNFKVESCHAPAGFVHHVARALHCDSYPAATSVVVANRNGAEKLREGTPYAGHEEEWQRAKAYTIGIGYGLANGHTPEESWDGHLVCIVGRKLLLDPSIPQVNRVKWGIEVAPVCFRVTEQFLRGISPLRGGDNGCYLDYRIRVGDTSYRASPDWTDAGERYGQIVRDLTVAIRPHLDRV